MYKKNSDITSDNQLVMTRRFLQKVLKMQFVFRVDIFSGPKTKFLVIKSWSSEVVFGSGVCFLILFVLMDAISLSLDLQRGLYFEKQNFALATITWGQWYLN